MLAKRDLEEEQEDQIFSAASLLRSRETRERAACHVTPESEEVGRARRACLLFFPPHRKAEQRPPNQNSDEVTGAAPDQSAFAGRRFYALVSPQLPTLLRHGGRGSDSRLTGRSRQRQHGLFFAAFHERQRLLVRFQPRPQTLGGEIQSQSSGDGDRELGRDPATQHDPAQCGSATQPAQPEMRAVSKSWNQQNGEGSQAVLSLPQVCVCELHADRTETESDGETSGPEKGSGPRRTEGHTGDERGGNRGPFLIPQPFAFLDRIYFVRLHEYRR